MFFDPIGQALCKRTLNLVERLNHKHGDRMRFYLSKADEAGHESDRQVGIHIFKTLPTPMCLTHCILVDSSMTSPFVILGVLVHFVS